MGRMGVWHMGEMGRVRNSDKSNQIPKYGENGSLAYGGNGCENAMIHEPVRETAHPVR